MKQSLGMLVLVLCLSYSSAAQEDAQSIKELIKIFPTAAAVSSTTELPTIVQAGISDIVKSNMGTIADSLKFSHGQILYFRNVKGDSTGIDSTWVVPMYDLRFALSDTTIGIDSYMVELRVDQRGQLIYINWPKSGYSDKAGVASWGDVLAYATHFAKLSKFYSPHYRVQLRFSDIKGKMVWVFQYPVKDLSNTIMLHTIEVDWQKPKLVKEYMDRY